MSARGRSERALLVGASFGSRPVRDESALEELGLLAESAGARVVGSLSQERPRPDAATFIGSGKLAEVGRLAAETSADVVLFDDALTPAQQRNIEKALELKTLDRPQLILDIFSQRARSREGRLQVELAQLDYMLPRLAGKGVLLSRLGGGIGTRGPGETKLETDRRRLRARMLALRREIDHVRRSRHTRRRARARGGVPVVALVGYTNAGKSTLFSALTQAETGASARVFMTLDPLLRRALLNEGQEILVVDTVGFIRKLPHALVAAFRATLEELVEADLLLHVADASASDMDEREAAVQAVLREVGAQDVARIDVLNKCDRLEPARRDSLQASRPDALLVSAQTGEGLPGLKQALASRLDLVLRRVWLRFPAAASSAVAGVYAAGRVLAQRMDGDALELEVDLPARSVGRFQEHLVG